MGAKMTPAQAAQILHIHEKTVSRAIIRGELTDHQERVPDAPMPAHGPRGYVVDIEEAMIYFARRGTLRKRSAPASDETGNNVVNDVVDTFTGLAELDALRDELREALRELHAATERIREFERQAPPRGTAGELPLGGLLESGAQVRVMTPTSVRPTPALVGVMTSNAPSALDSLDRSGQVHGGISRQRERSRSRPVRRPAWARSLRTSPLYTPYWRIDAEQARVGRMHFQIFGSLCHVKSQTFDSHRRRVEAGEMPSGLGLDFVRVSKVYKNGKRIGLRYVDATQRAAWLDYWTRLGHVQEPPTDEQIDQALTELASWISDPDEAAAEAVNVAFENGDRDGFSSPRLERHNDAVNPEETGDPRDDMTDL